MSAPPLTHIGSTKPRTDTRAHTRMHAPSQASDQHQFIEAMRRVDLKQITKRQQVEKQLMEDVPVRLPA